MDKNLDVANGANVEGIETAHELDRRDLGLVFTESHDKTAGLSKASPDENFSVVSDCSRDDNDIHYQYLDQNGIMQLTNTAIPLIKCAKRLGSTTKTWSKPMVRSLIQCYREYMDEFRDPAIKQKDVWMKAANLMRRIGYNLSWSECDRKWRNLKHTFKTFYYRKNENKRVSWEFYDDLFMLFVPNPEDANKQRHRKSRVLFPPEFQESSEDITTGIIPKKEARLSETPPPFEVAPKWFTDYMKEFEKRQWMYIEEIRRIYEISLEAERQRHKAMEILVNMIQRDLPK